MASTRELVMARLCPNAPRDNYYTESTADRSTRLWNLFSWLSDEQYCYLVRVALSTRSEAKYPLNPDAFFLFEMAKATGLDVAALEGQQQDKIASRQKSQAERIKSLQKKIEEMETA